MITVAGGWKVLRVEGRKKWPTGRQNVLRAKRGHKTNGNKISHIKLFRNLRIGFALHALDWPKPKRADM